MPLTTGTTRVDPPRVTTPALLAMESVIFGNGREKEDPADIAAELGLFWDEVSRGL